MSPLEIGVGRPLTTERLPRLPLSGPVLTPRQALEKAVRPALTDGPCFVSFSGGRDSSAVLALAVSVAREHGLPDPIPCSHRFSDPESDETAWQTDVVRHLGLKDWVVRTWNSELDVIGPAAQAVLKRWGTVFPFNAHFIPSLLEDGQSGTLLTGIGGDEILSPSSNQRVMRLLTGQVRPRPDDLLRLGLAVSPRLVRAAVLRRRLTMPDWLTAGAATRARRESAAMAAHGSLWWHADVLRDWLPSARRRAGLSTLAAVAQVRGHQLLHPLQDEGFLRSLATHFPQGFDSRDAAMRLLFGDLLPSDTLARQSKASFSQPFFSDYSREFVRTWTGQGVDSSIVHQLKLRDTWGRSTVDARSLSLLQRAWLAEDASPQAGLESSS